jgi:hypothetical protein
MTTAAQLASFTNKRLINYEDFETRMLRYLKKLAEDSTQTHFLVNGSFQEQMPISSPGANQVQLDLKPSAADRRAHDGIGHILDITLGTGGHSTVFPNVAAQVYEVGAKYVEKPVGIQVNPRTGKPEYSYYMEDVGRQENPDLVTDNTTTITFRVDSLFEQGVAVANHTGRLVRVFKLIPADGATVAATAIETCTVFFGGGQNQITTTGLLGQAEVDTDTAVYYVQLVGLSVMKNTATNRPSQEDDAFFAGTVTGNGGTPTVFNNSGQNILGAGAGSASAFNPYTTASPLTWNNNATNVQDAIEQVMDDINAGVILEDVITTATHAGPAPINFTLSSSDLGGQLQEIVDQLGDAGGASYIGADGATFFDAISGNVYGGIGQSPTSTMEALIEVDNALQNARTYVTAASGGGSNRTRADYTGATSLQSAIGAGDTRRIFLVDGNAYTINGSTVPYATVTEVFANGAEIRLSNATSILQGLWRGCALRSLTASFGWVASDFSSAAARFEDCRFESGHLRVSSPNVAGSAAAPKTIFTRCRFEQINAGSPVVHNSSVLIDDTDSANAKLDILFDDCDFEGVHTNLTAPDAIVRIRNIGNATNHNAARGRIVFRGCRFYNNKTTTASCPSISLENTGDTVIRFEDCHFDGVSSGSTAAVIEAFSGVHLEMERCTVTAPHGIAFYASDVSGFVQSCKFICGTDTTIAHPQFFTAAAPASKGLRLSIRDVELMLNSGCVRNVTGGNEIPCVSLGLDSSATASDVANTAGSLHVDGLRIQNVHTSGHAAPYLCLAGNTNFSAAGESQYTFDNISVNGNNADTTVAATTPWGGSGSASWVAVRNAIVTNLLVEDWGNSTAHSAHTIVAVNQSKIRNLVLRGVDSSPNARESAVYICEAGAGFDISTIDGLWIGCDAGESLVFNLTLGLITVDCAHATVKNIELNLLDINSSSTADGAVHLLGNYATIDGLVLYKSAPLGDTTMSLVYNEGIGNDIRDVRVETAAASPWTPTLIKNAGTGQQETRVTGCMIHYDGNSATAIDMADSPRCMVVNNIVVGVDAVAPPALAGMGGTATVNANNIVAAS